MFTSVEKLIALRNLRPKKKDGFLKVISLFSFIGIMLGVAILIIVMSVMNGFRTDLTNKILGFNPHIIIKPYNDVKIDSKLKDQLNKNFPNIQVLDSFSGEGVVINNEYAKGIIIKGLDPKNKKNYRTRCSGLIKFNSENILIDTSPDLRSQLLTNKVRSIEKVFYTHLHADQTHGINDLRVFYIQKKKTIPVYADKPTQKYLLNTFKYCFVSNSKQYPATLKLNSITNRLTLKNGKKKLPKGHF